MITATRTRWVTTVITHDAKRAQRQMLPQLPGVYAIFRCGLLLYVGTSLCISARLTGMHKIRLAIGDVINTKIMTDDPARMSLEAGLIRRLQPPANRTGTRHAAVMEPLVTIQTGLSSDDVAVIERIAARDGLSLAAVVRLLVREALRARRESA